MFYRAKIHMAVSFHDGPCVMETIIELPDNYRPSPGSWINHPMLDGRCPIMLVGFESETGHIVVTLGAGAHAPTHDRDEWLSEQKHWRVAKKPTLPFIMTMKGPNFDVTWEDMP